MPTQDNCDDLKVESCVDDKGQTINGGDSYDVPTGRYVKHVVNVCGTGGSAAGGGLETKACPDGGLEETWNGADEMCLSIATEPDSALVLDGGVLKIDSTKLKVTSDNVLPAGTDPGLVSNVPVFTDPDGNVWNNQSDYNKWLYEEQKRQDEDLENLDLSEYVTQVEFEADQDRQDDEAERIERESKARDLALELELLYLVKQGQSCDIDRYCQFNPVEPPFSNGNMFNASGNVVKITSGIFDNITPEVGNTLRISGDSLTDEFASVITNIGDREKPPTGHHVFSITIEDTVPTTISGAAGGTNFEIASCENTPFVTQEEFENDQQRQDAEFNSDQKRQDNEIKSIQDKLDFCKIDGKFYCFAPGVLHADYEAAFTSNGVYLTTAWSFEVGDELTVTTNDGSVDIYLIDDVGEIQQEPPNGNEIIKPKRLYTFTTACAHNYVMKGTVDLSSCVYPYVTPVEFAEDQERQDDVLALQEAEIAKLKNQIVELEEEIDAIAPASERGKWKFADSGTITGPGIFTAYDTPADTSGNATGTIQIIRSVWLHSDDLDGGKHSFDNVEVGNLLELFVQESDDYGLFEIVKVNKYSSGQHWILDVNFIRTLDAASRFDKDEVARLKIFQAPEGGAADDYLLKDFSVYQEVG